jgi:multiple sugar transport system substrate-binding protein
MNTKPRRSIARLAVAGLTVAAIFSACGGSTASPSAAAPSKTPAAASAAPSTAAGPVTITVVSLKPGSEQSAFDAFNAQVAQFEAKYPNIKVTPREYEWTGPTFAAELLGGTLPDVFTIPFTDGKSLIEQGQLADISTAFGALPYATKFNPNVLAAAQDANGKVFAMPTAAYGIGLQYNRALFTAAGLDPDKPPTTWDEIRADAKIIAEKTGMAGFAQMSQNNTGGWMLTTLTYAQGGRMQEVNGTTTTSTITNAGTKKALETLREMRWTDNSMGSNFLLDWGTMNQEFAAGKVGMYMGGSDVYTSLRTSNNIDPATYGLAALPLSTDPNAGVLVGGTLAAVNVKASDAVKDAAVKWIDFYYMTKLTSQESAVQDAKTLSEAKQPVGVPALPIFDKATLDQSLAWIKDYINVPLQQMSSFTSGIFSQPLVGEPSVKTQEMYATLDPVVQAVLTDKNADIDALLTKANTDVQALIDKNHFNQPADALLLRPPAVTCLDLEGPDGTHCRRGDRARGHDDRPHGTRDPGSFPSDGAAPAADHPERPEHLRLPAAAAADLRRLLVAADPAGARDERAEDELRDRPSVRRPRELQPGPR